PVNMNRLAPKFFNLAPGSRIVGNTFGIDGWQPDYRESLPNNSECESWCEALLWIVPAKIEGTWSMGDAAVALKQNYQVGQGTVASGGKRAEMPKGKLLGKELTFTATGMLNKGVVSSDGRTITGSVTTQKGAPPWTATRR